jgi:hypothetical protein
MQNFGKIKNALNDLLVESMITKNNTNKELFKKYLKIVKESDVLRTQFMVFNNIETRIDSDPLSINLFISENMRLFEKFNVDQIEKANKKLLDLIPEGKLSESYDLAGLHESISSLICTKRSPKNVDKITSEIKNITNYISNNKEKVINECVELPPSVLTKLVVEKFNEKYQSLDEFEREAIKVLTETDFEARKSFHQKAIDECIQLVEASLKTADEESIGKLQQVKTKLVNDKQGVKEDQIVSEVFKLIDLRYNLLSE